MLNGDQSIFKFLVMINHPKTYVTLPHSETFLGSVWEGHSQSTKSPRQNSRCLVKGQVEACIWATLRNKAKRNPMTIIGKITLKTLFSWKENPPLPNLAESYVLSFLSLFLVLSVYFIFTLYSFLSPSAWSFFLYVYTCRGWP